jgi:hypothetical protein
MRPEEAAAFADQSFIASAQPHIQADVAKQLNALVNKTMMSLDQGKLTPELALYAWMEYRATMIVAKRFATRARVGASVGAQFANELDNTGNNS